MLPAGYLRRDEFRLRAQPLQARGARLHPLGELFERVRSAARSRRFGI